MSTDYEQHYMREHGSDMLIEAFIATDLDERYSLLMSSIARLTAVLGHRPSEHQSAGKAAWIASVREAEDALGLDIEDTLDAQLRVLVQGRIALRRARRVTRSQQIITDRRHARLRRRLVRAGELVRAADLDRMVRVERYLDTVQIEDEAAGWKPDWL